MDDHGTLVANLSASDLRGISESNLKLLTKPVLEFLKLMGNGKVAHPVVVSSRDTIESILYKVYTSKVHRVWVVDSAQRPIGVVALGDIISFLAGNVGSQWK